MGNFLSKCSGYIEYFVIGIVLLALFCSSLWYFSTMTEEVADNVSPTQTAVNSSPTDFPTPTPDPYEGWQTYSNQTFKISLKYPLSWKLQLNSSMTRYGDLVAFSHYTDNTVLNSELNDGINFAISKPDTSGQTLAITIQEIVDTTFTLYNKNITFEDTKVGGFEAKYSQDCNLAHCQLTYIVKRENQLIEIFASIAGENTSSYLAEFNSVISTIKL